MNENIEILVSENIEFKKSAYYIYYYRGYDLIKELFIDFSKAKKKMNFLKKEKRRHK
jgi:hypothetical protein